MTVLALPANGFSKPVTVSIGSLPAGVTATPSTVSVSPGALQQIMVSASSAVPFGNYNFTLTGTAGSLSDSTDSSLSVASPPNQTSATVSTGLYDFGDNLVNNKITQTVAVITNTGTNALTMNPALSGDASFTIVQSYQSCSTSLAPGSTCNMVVSYDPTVASYPNAQNAVLNMGFSDVQAPTQQTIGITGTSGALPAGQVTSTDNPQVALYTMTLPFPGSMTVSFGPTTQYGLSTWTQSTESNGGQVSIFVAGMKASTTYHMAATVQFTNGLTVGDADHTFTTGAIPSGGNLHLTATTTAGATPQPGLELLNTLSTVVVADLSGNVLWTYTPPLGNSGSMIDGVKMLPDGDMLMTGYSPDSQDQRNSVRDRIRYQVAPRVWFAVGSDYNTGLPFQADQTVQQNISEYGQAVVNHLNFDRGRIHPYFTQNASVSADLYQGDKASVRLQADGENLSNTMEVIDFGGLFSGNAIGPGRTYMLRLTTTF